MSDKTAQNTETAVAETPTLPAFVPTVDLAETADGWVLRADLPGANKSELAVRVDDGVLTIEGESKSGLEGHVLRAEFRERRYFRRFRLGEQVDPDGIDAAFSDGVLTVSLPRHERVMPRKIPVQVR